jgi:cytochrome c oxidase subunit 2
MILFGAIVTAIGIPLALIIPWFPTSASTQAGNIHSLYDVLLIASVPIFVLVSTVIMYSVWKFRMKPGEELKDGPPIHGNTRVEVVWTAAPALLIIGLVAFGYAKLHANEANQANAIIVNVTERQFAFEFSYPQGNGKSVASPVLYLPDNRPVVFHLRSLDVIHSFFVPEFSEKLDAVPGITTTLRVTPNRVGSYPVECTELCGPGHSLMRASVVVVPPDRFTSWLSSQSTSTPPPIGTPPFGAGDPAIPGSTGGAGSSSSAGGSTGGG